LSQLRILLDECIDRRLARAFPEHEVRTVPQMQWSGFKDGALLTEAAKQFDVFITVDRNLSFQQHLPGFGIAVFVLHARSNRLQDLAELVPNIERALLSPVAGFATTLPAD
jgi:predicted nuclease of predicted toxin-antitoxin system